MDYLLDTCAFIYLFNDDPSLGRVAQSIIQDPQNRCLVSIASVWEIAIKANPARDARKRITIEKPFREFITEALALHRIELLPIDIESLAVLSTLMQLHGDPFDRLIISQAYSLGIPVLTNDPQFAGFDVSVIW